MNERAPLPPINFTALAEALLARAGQDTGQRRDLHNRDVRGPTQLAATAQSDRSGSH